ncbi:hypothetical protein [Mesorhizobium xinjiangense]|uniref:hypothetical protein n=1 Tax=Mesorhizobium xinjiangense TaxID=2678685 RepID=UPI0012ED9FA2|nr:hypothetical protein [Mesorhizobium xinjiangense]
MLEYFSSKWEYPSPRKWGKTPIVGQFADTLSRLLEYIQGINEIRSYDQANERFAR